MIESVLKLKLENMFLKYPEQKELSGNLFSIILEMMQEDFDAIAQENKRLKIIFNYLICIIEKVRGENVKKQYVIEILDVFLDNDVVLYLNQKLKEHKDDYILAIKSARAELHCSQWSDTDSTHWQRAIKCFKRF